MTSFSPATDLFLGGISASANCSQLGPPLSQQIQQQPSTQQQEPQPPTATCPDGSQAPNGDVSQCPAETPTCPSGESLGTDNQCYTSACNSLLGPILDLFGTCSPTGPSCPSNWSLDTDGMCDAVVCPAGETLESDICVATNSSCPTGFTLKGNTCVFSGCPEYYTEQNGECVLTSCPSGYTLQGSTCAYTGNNSQNQIPPPLIASWQVSPLLVQSGGTTQVTWSAENVSSCDVTDEARDLWTTTSGSETSSSLTAQIVFNLTCEGLDGSQISTSSTVNIVPVFREH